MQLNFDVQVTIRDNASPEYIAVVISVLTEGFTAVIEKLCGLTGNVVYKRDDDHVQQDL